MTENYNIIDKIVIKAELELLTGMHIGSNNDFAPIGAVDSPIVRNPIDMRPIIPGSSIKGKMRYLLSKADSDTPILPSIENEGIEIKRLFGAGSPEIVYSRLQFCDSFLTQNSVDELKNKTELYLTEGKWENTIDRIDCVANPRQLERVPAGAKFNFTLVYNIEKEEEVEEDFENIAKSFKLLHLDYIGGSGTRGYGKVKFSNFNVKLQHLTNKNTSLDENKLQIMLAESENYVLSV